jgi:hypothetical protein
MDTAVRERSTPELLDLLRKRMRLLVAGDETFFREFALNALNTPLVDVRHARMAWQTEAMLGVRGNDCHCLLVDADSAGLNVLLARPNSIAVVVAGAGGARIGARAEAMGAWDTFDKAEIAGCQPDFVRALRGAVAMGFLLRGRLCNPDCRRMLRLLGGTSVMSVEEWTDKAGMSRRSLERLCGLHCGLTPGQVLQFYYGLEYLIASSALDAMEDSPAFVETEDDAYRPYLQFVEDNIALLLAGR